MTELIIIMKLPVTNCSRQCHACVIHWKVRVVMMPTLSYACVIHWKVRVIMMPTLSSLVAPQVVIMTTCGATSDDKVGIMTTHGFSVCINTRLLFSDSTFFTTDIHVCDYWHVSCPDNCMSLLRPWEHPCIMMIKSHMRSIQVTGIYMDGEENTKALHLLFKC